MTPSFTTEAWALARHFWVIVMQHPPEVGQNTSTLLQAEESGATYVLAFTSENKAAAAIAELGVGAQARTAQLRAGAELDMISAVCRLGAAGIMVDFDAAAEPGARRWAWRRRLVANA
jgi:hypothetical protein